MLKLGEQCIHFSNYEFLEYLSQEGMKIDKSIVTKSVSVGNLFLFKHFLQDKRIPKDILFIFFENENPEIVKYILEQGRIKINHKNVCDFCIMFISIIWYFKIIFGISSNYLKQHL